MIKKLAFIYNFLSRLSKREKLVLYCAVFFISLTFLDRLIISPIITKIQVLNKQIQDKEAAVRTSMRILAQKDKIASESTRYSPYISSLKSEEEEVTAILKEIESLANKSSVYLIDLKPSGIKDMGSSKKYLIALNCEAQMEQLIDFFYNIENSDKLFSIDKYQIIPASKESSVARATLTISMIFLP